jgi:hypothetical protein
MRLYIWVQTFLYVSGYFNNYDVLVANSVLETLN